MKRKILMIALLAICISMLAYGTVAYFTAEGTARNVITAGSVKISLQEWADSEKTEPFPKDGVNGVVPGAQITKIAEVKNTGENPAYIRVSVEKVIELAEGVTGEVELDLVSLDFNTKDWTLKDGFYYYNTALPAGETTTPLFTTVSFAENMGNLYQNSKAVVNVHAYATQAANNGASVWEAAGWPEA